MGSSIVKRAFAHALVRPGGVNLGLDRIPMEIWWQGYSGLKFVDLKKKLLYLKTFENDPDFILIHCGGNGIGSNVFSLNLFQLIAKFKQDLLDIKKFFPRATLIWSQILPRNQWRYSQNVKAMERCRNRLNRAVAKFVLKQGGCYLKHPALLENIEQFLSADGVHLSELGNSLFLNSIQGGLESFAQKQFYVFPTSY